MNWSITRKNVMQVSTVIDQFAYCLRLITLRFCMCYGFKGIQKI